VLHEPSDGVRKNANISDPSVSWVKSYLQFKYKASKSHNKDPRFKNS